MYVTTAVILKHIAFIRDTRVTETDLSEILFLDFSAQNILQQEKDTQQKS